jgi:hypothetical protein
LGSSVQNTDTYEEDDLRRAELEATPRLTGIGFPNNTNSSLAKKKTAAANNVATLQTVHHKLRKEQLSQQNPIISNTCHKRQEQSFPPTEYIVTSLQRVVL